MGARKIIGLMACDPQGTIGNKGIIPWSYPEELAHFRQTTYQQIMVMGRKTFEAIPLTTLNDRFNIVFSREHKEPCWIGETIVFVSCLKDFLGLTGVPPEKEMYMIGGAQIASLFFKANLISEMLLTHIHKCHRGDTFFSLDILKGWDREATRKGDGFTVYRYMPPQNKKPEEFHES